MCQTVFRTYSLCLTIFFLTLSCNKLVEIPEPVDTITSIEVFSNDAAAEEAVTAIYYDMIRAHHIGLDIAYGNGLTSINCGLSADELSSLSTNPFETNSLLATSGLVGFWKASYFDIYLTNAVIEGLEKSNQLNEFTKMKLLGEAKFLRSFIYFYLVNLFGDVPLVLNTEYTQSNVAKRIPVADVYNNIVNDLIEAKTLLSSADSDAVTERTKVNSSTASALLARVYLYLKDYNRAEDEASLVINQSDFYQLNSELVEAFGKNNSEAIWQLEISGQYYPYASWEGFKMIPENIVADYDSITVAQNWEYFVPPYFLTNALLSAFEPGDKRKTSWLVNTGNLNGTEYYYPFKYRTRQGSVNGNPSQNYTMLRLAELYLIRAEARIQIGKLDQAVADINVIRNRAGLASLQSLSQTDALLAVQQERRIEFFAEWGHRWLDLKRWDTADLVLAPLKGNNWQTTDKLYPIPYNEIQKNASLTQNPGY